MLSVIHNHITEYRFPMPDTYRYPERMRSSNFSLTKQILMRASFLNPADLKFITKLKVEMRRVVYFNAH